MAGITAVTAGYVSRQLYLLYNAGLKVVKAHIVSLSSSDISFVIYAEIDNKGDISASVKDQHYEVFLNNILVSRIDSPKDIHINSNGKTIIPISISFSPNKVIEIGLANLALLLLDRKSMVIEIKGYLSLTAGVINLKKYPVYIKYNMQELIDIAREPKK